MLRHRCKTTRKWEATRQIGATYVPYMETIFSRAEQLVLDLFSHPIPHVLTLHANALDQGFNRLVYTAHFLTTLKRKALKKQPCFPARW